jgi:hypothetical protein
MVLGTVLPFKISVATYRPAAALQGFDELDIV